MKKSHIGFLIFCFLVFFALSSISVFGESDNIQPTVEPVPSLEAATGLTPIAELPTPVPTLEAATGLTPTVEPKTEIRYLPMMFGPPADQPAMTPTFVPTKPAATATFVPTLPINH